MKIKSLQISNILSFKYEEDINQASKLEFDNNFNILIGQNGAGKSTVLEIINFIFRRVLFIPYERNVDLYSQRLTLDPQQKKSILHKPDRIQNYKDFRLERNYDFENKPQNIRITVDLDDIDSKNIQLLQKNKEKLVSILGLYSGEEIFGVESYSNRYVIDIELNSTNQTFSVNTQTDLGYKYLTGYNLYKEIIEIYNYENSTDLITPLSETFSLISCYRNYNSYSAHASLGGGNTALKQIQNIRSSEFSKSTNAAEGGEPSIFSLVRLRMADTPFQLILTELNKEQCELEANKLDFVLLINEKLKIVNIKVEIKLLDHSSWNFAFSFIDTRKKRRINDINSLSAGQKAIIHLVFEAYGRGHLKGGLVIIDEPEIHLHYQFQNEYLRVIEKLNIEQNCQYILVTHSESLINSETIKNVIRLSLDENNFTKINQPLITADQKWLVKILDNIRSTHAFFGSKVLLVEGEDDRYFFRALIQEIERKNKKGFSQDITVLDIGGKGKKPEIWKRLFESFGLKTYFIADLDYSNIFYPTETSKTVHNSQEICTYLDKHTDLYSKIENEYKNNTFILKAGSLEQYLEIHNKGLSNVIDFCHNSLVKHLQSVNIKNSELKMIMSMITEENEESLW